MLFFCPVPSSVMVKKLNNLLKKGPDICKTIPVTLLFLIEWRLDACSSKQQKFHVYLMKSKGDDLDDFTH